MVRLRKSQMVEQTLELLFASYKYFGIDNLVLKIIEEILSDF
jgi:hypothetical protein